MNSIVKRLHENRTQVPENLMDVASEIRQKIKEGVAKYMISEGFPSEEVESYSRVDVSFSGDQLVVEVGAELGYHALENLCSALNPIIATYDKDSYFEPITSGIIGAWLSVDSIISESKEVYDVDDMRAELVKYGNYTEEEALELKGLDLAKAWSELPADIKEGKERSMEFATDSEAYDWAEENGYTVTKIQNGSHSDKACIAWMRKVDEDTVDYQSSLNL